MEHKKSGYLDIADRLETMIHEGVFKPNEKLKTTEELASEFQVTPKTVQRSLSRLTAKGLIVRNPRRGTYVSSAVKGKVLAALSSNPFISASSYPRLFFNALMRYSSMANIELKAYFNYNPGDRYQGIREIEKDIHDGLVKCIVPICLSYQQSVWLNSACACPVVDAPPMDLREMARLATEHLLQRGRRRIKVFSMQPPDECDSSEQDGVDAAFAAAGLKSRGDEVMLGGRRSAEAYAAVKALLAKGERFDGLFINHDIIAPGAVIALLEEGLRFPRDLSLVCHENKGEPILGGLSLTKIVLDEDARARETIACIVREWQTIKPGRRFSEGGKSIELRIGGST